MNQKVDLIMLIALEENLPYEERRNRIAKIIEDNYKVYGETKRRIDKETTNDSLPRFEFRDIEED